MPRGPCVIHCPEDKGGGFWAALAVLGAVALVAVVVAWLTANWPLVLGAAVAVAVVAAGALKVVAVVSRKLAQLALVSGPLAWRLAGYRQVPVQPEVQAELAAPPLAIESGLLRGQTDPAMHEVLRGVSRGLRDRYGTLDDSERMGR